MRGQALRINVKGLSPSMPIRLGGTPRPTNSSAHAAKMAALDIAPPGKRLSQSVIAAPPV